MCNRHADATPRSKRRVGRLFHRVYSASEETLGRDCPMLCGSYATLDPTHEDWEKPGAKCQGMAPVPCFSGEELCCANPWTYFERNKFSAAAAPLGAAEAQY